MASFWDNFREAMGWGKANHVHHLSDNQNGNNSGYVGPDWNNVGAADVAAGVAGAASIPVARSAQPKKVWGFEEDKSRYGDVKSVRPEDTDALTWRDYTITTKDKDGVQKKFSIGFDGEGRISGVRSKDKDGNIHGYYGKDNLKNFFSQFDRDATSYSVSQEEEWIGDDGVGEGAAAVIFDSDRDNAPFIPSEIFRDRTIRPIPDYGRDGLRTPHLYDTKLDAPIYFTNTPNFYKSYRKINKA